MTALGLTAPTASLRQMDLPEGYSRVTTETLTAILAASDPLAEIDRQMKSWTDLEDFAGSQRSLLADARALVVALVPEGFRAADSNGAGRTEAESAAVERTSETRELPSPTERQRMIVALMRGSTRQVWRL